MSESKINKQLSVGYIEPDPSKVGNKCPVMIGDNKKLCCRPAMETYRAIVVLDDGRKVKQKLHVCIRHKEIFEEFLNDQGEYQ